jgi:predicted RNA binding protein YcfA (HicA-like mRNA interferase family)
MQKERLGRDVREVPSVGCAVVGRRRKLYDKIVSGRSDANIPFEQTVNLLVRLGFLERISGSHHIFVREDIEEPINLQKVGSECKPYQVQQMRVVLKKYNLGKEL